MVSSDYYNTQKDIKILDGKTSITKKALGDYMKKANTLDESKYHKVVSQEFQNRLKKFKNN